MFAAPTAEPIAALEVIRMNVIKAMNGIEKTSDCLGHAVALDMRRNA